MHTRLLPHLSLHSQSSYKAIHPSILAHSCSARECLHAPVPQLNSTTAAAHMALKMKAGMKQGTCKGACTCCGAKVRTCVVASRSANSISEQHPFVFSEA